MNSIKYVLHKIHSIIRHNHGIFRFWILIKVNWSKFSASQRDKLKLSSLIELKRSKADKILVYLTLRSYYETSDEVTNKLLKQQQTNSNNVKFNILIDFPSRFFHFKFGSFIDSTCYEKHGAFNLHRFKIQTLETWKHFTILKRIISVQIKSNFAHRVSVRVWVLIKFQDQYDCVFVEKLQNHRCWFWRIVRAVCKQCSFETFIWWCWLWQAKSIINVRILFCILVNEKKWMLLHLKLTSKKYCQRKWTATMHKCKSKFWKKIRK